MSASTSDEYSRLRKLAIHGLGANPPRSAIFVVDDTLDVFMEHGQPLNALTAQAATNSARWFPHLHDKDITSDNEHLKHMALGLTEEAGEVAGIIKKATGYRPEQRDHTTVTTNDLAHELVDVIVYAFNIAAHLGIDLDAALHEKTVICQDRWG